MKDTPTDPTGTYEDEPPEERRAMRRDLDLRLELVSHYSDEPVAHRATDLSPFGVWIDTSMPLHPGAEVVLSMTPPRFDGRELTVFAKVARAVTGRRRGDRGPLGMGLQFEDLT
ncbi:MAG: PilZ domain-containing protein, partial [Deltaproteobacteria bacterium]|nr:PilZ domain-containing protein [Deltaproteobacteria bacterium]